MVMLAQIFDSQCIYIDFSRDPTNRQKHQSENMIILGRGTVGKLTFTQTILHVTHVL